MFPQFTTIQAGLYKKRFNGFPKLKSIEDIKIEGEWAKTENKEDFLVFQVIKFNEHYK